MPMELFLISAVPGDIAAGIGAAGAGAIAALWRQHIVDGRKADSNLREMMSAMNASTEVNRDITRAVDAFIHK